MTDKKMTLDEMVAEMNKTHALVLHDGRCMVFIQSEDSSTLKFVRPKELSRLCANELYCCGTTIKGRPIMKNKIKAWMMHRNRRTYPNGVYWRPVREGEEVQHVCEAFNIWTVGDGDDYSPARVFADKHGITFQMKRN
jgi:hypothetical protein